MKLNATVRGEGTEAVVFLHGLFGRARNLGTLQRAASRRFRTVALDLRSHGESPAGKMDYPDMAADVLETLDGLGIGEFAVVGHSMGGKVAMLTALTAPERVTRLLVADMAPVRTGQGHGAMIARLAALTFPPKLDRAGAVALLEPAAGSRAVAELLAQNLRLGDAPGWGPGFAEIRRGIGVIEGWPEVHAAPYPGPALFLRGGDSDYVRPEHEAAIRAFFPKARIETIEGAGHWLHVERPADFLHVMMAFLTE